MIFGGADIPVCPTQARMPVPPFIKIIEGYALRFSHWRTLFLEFREQRGIKPKFGRIGAADLKGSLVQGAILLNHCRLDDPFSVTIQILNRPIAVI